MNDKSKLQGIFNACALQHITVNNYDFTQDDDCDESGSGGVWDLAGVVADSLLDKLFELNDSRNDRDLETVYYQTHADLQSLLYNLLRTFTDTDNKKIYDIVYWLLHHNKNLTKQQMSKLYDIESILTEF